MKNIKKLSLVLLIMALGIGIIGCANDNKDIEDEATEDLEIQEEEMEVEEDEEEEEIADEEDTEEVDSIDAMIDSSDYISKIKLIQKGKDNFEIKILDNIKDNLSESDLPELELLENRAYLIFLKDVDGNLVLTDENNGLVLLEGDNHELFEKINKKVHN